MDLSVIHSAVSMDSPRCEGRMREGRMREGELAMEVQRLQRRNSLLEKSKLVLEEELQLYREEISSKARKIQHLTLKLAKPSPLPHPPSPPPMHHSQQIDLILLEKEEQLNVAGQSLREQAMRLQELQAENLLLKEQLGSRNDMVRQLKESSRAQLSYQRAQIEALQEQLVQKDKEMAGLQLFFQNLSQKEGSKWQKLNENLKEQLRIAQQESQDALSAQANFNQERQQWKEKKEELCQQISSLNSTIAFLQALLEQAKGEFIDVQLRQQEQLQREEREKREYRKRNQLLKTQLKSLKADNVSTCPSNKSTRTPSTVSITPFRTHSTRSKPNQEHQ